jgi:hypothetical protein
LGSKLFKLPRLFRYHLAFNEAIIEAMVRDERPWGDLHHRSYFLPELSRIESGEFKSTIVGSVDGVVNPLAGHGVYAKGNMANISEMIPINISKNPEIVENIFIGEECSQDEITQYTTLFKEF